MAEWLEVVSMVEDDYPLIRIEEINEGVGLICVVGIVEGNTGITINIINNLIGLMYRSGEMDLDTGDNRIPFSTAFDIGTTYVLHYELTALSDGAIIGGDFTNLDDIAGFDCNVNEPAHIKYSALINH